jgi:hypothetical protein
MADEIYKNKIPSNERSLSSSKERFGLLAPRSGRPGKGLSVTHDAARRLYFWDNVNSVCILGTNNVDSGEQGSDCDEQCCIRDEPSRAHTTTKAETCGARVADGRVECTFRSEESLGHESLRLGVVFCVVQNAPVGAKATSASYQAWLKIDEPDGTEDDCPLWNQVALVLVVLSNPMGNGWTRVLSLVARH